MQPAENKDYSRDVILRLSPTRNTIIVEEQKPGDIAAYGEIDPLELYYVINQSYASNDYLDSGFLPEHCITYPCLPRRSISCFGIRNCGQK